MLKFLYYTDPHNKLQNPTARLDNFKETIFNKQRYVGRLARELGVAAVFVGGDFLDKPDNSDEFVRSVQLLHQEYGVPIYGIIGNHEEWGYNPETYSRTSFGLLEGPGIIKRLYMDKPIIFTDDSLQTKVAVTGCDAHFDLDKNGRVSDYIDIPDSEDCIKIHIIHGFLTDDKNKWDKIPHTCISDILATKADILLTGHEHSGFEVIQVTKDMIEKYHANNKIKLKRVNSAVTWKGEGKLFCNPGALARVSCGVGDVNLEVKVALITVDKDEFSIELIKLPPEIARPSNEVLDRERLEADKAAKEQIQVIMSNVSNIETANSFDIYEVLNSIKESDELPDNIIEGVRTRLQTAEEQMTNGVI